MLPDRLEALIFDFDRTLAPLGNFVLWREARPRMHERYLEHGVAAADLEAAPRGCFGLYGHVARGGFLDSEALLRAQEEVSAILAEYEAAGIGRVEMFPSAVRLLSALPELGIVAGIVSSNPTWVIRDVLEHQGVLDAFSAIVGRDGLREIKPSPEGMLLCCELLELPPEQCLGVGDNLGDIEASRAIGMRAVGVTTGVSTRAELTSAGAVAVYDDLDDLRAALLAWRESHPRRPRQRG